VEAAKQLPIDGGVKDEAVSGRVDEVFSAAATLRDDDGETGSHGLVDDKSPRLAAAGKDEAAGKGVEDGQVARALVAGEVDVGGKGRGGDEMPECGSFGTVADEDKRPGSATLAIGEPCLDEAMDIFLFR